MREGEKMKMMESRELMMFFILLLGFFFFFLVFFFWVLEIQVYLSKEKKSATQKNLQLKNDENRHCARLGMN